MANWLAAIPNPFRREDGVPLAEVERERPPSTAYARYYDAIAWQARVEERRTRGISWRDQVNADEEEWRLIMDAYPHLAIGASRVRDFRDVQPMKLDGLSEPPRFTWRQWFSFAHWKRSYVLLTEYITISRMR